jgi:hypothetical protein
MFSGCTSIRHASSGSSIGPSHSVALRSDVECDRAVSRITDGGQLRFGRRAGVFGYSASSRSGLEVRSFARWVWLARDLGCTLPTRGVRPWFDGQSAGGAVGLVSMTFLSNFVTSRNAAGPHPYGSGSAGRRVSWAGPWEHHARASASWSDARDEAALVGGFGWHVTARFR